MTQSAQGFPGGDALARAIARDGAEGPVSASWIAIVPSAHHAARAGSLLQWRHGPRGVETVLRPYRGEHDPDVAVLLVAADEALAAMTARGFAAIPGEVRRGRLLPFVLKTQDQIEEAGLADFIEDLGLVFPKH